MARRSNPRLGKPGERRPVAARATWTPAPLRQRTRLRGWLNDALMIMGSGCAAIGTLLAAIPVLMAATARYGDPSLSQDPGFQRALDWVIPGAPLAAMVLGMATLAIGALAWRLERKTSTAGLGTLAVMAMGATVAWGSVFELMVMYRPTP